MAPDEQLATGHPFSDDAAVMQYALQIAARGLGSVEPNPMVGAVIVDDQRCLIAEGWHAQHGEAHAEIVAIRNAPQTAGHRLFVTLEPCSHHGKTPPCAEAVIAAEFREVVIGCQDPAEHVAGQGIARLRQAGFHVQVGLMEAEAKAVIAPFSMLHQQGRPWVHGKWAMTLDGKIAAASGHSQWISGPASREVVHELRGRVDAVVTGSGTIRSDDPQLTARPPGPRVATRVVLDSGGTSVLADSKLIRTLDQAPLIVAVGESADAEAVQSLKKLGATVLTLPTAAGGGLDVQKLLNELGQRRMTNVLLEAGGTVMGSFFDAQLIDEVHAFVAPKLVGGADAASPIGGNGRPTIPELSDLCDVSVRQLEDDILLQGRIRR